MSRIYNTIRNEIEQQLLKEAHGAEESDFTQGEEKAATIRVPRYLLHAIDAMAATVHQSRNGFINDLLVDSMNDAVDGYCAAFGKENEASARAQFFELVQKFQEGVLTPRDVRNQEDDE